MANPRRLDRLRAGPESLPAGALFRCANRSWGGRVTGSQQYGQKETVKGASQSCTPDRKLPDGDLAAIFFVVTAVEQAIIKQGLNYAVLSKSSMKPVAWVIKPKTCQPTPLSLTLSCENKLLPWEKTTAYAYELTALADIMENLDDLAELSQIMQEVKSSGRPPL